MGKGKPREDKVKVFQKQGRGGKVQAGQDKDLEKSGKRKRFNGGDCEPQQTHTTRTKNTNNSKVTEASKVTEVTVEERDSSSDDATKEEDMSFRAVEDAENEGKWHWLCACVCG